MASKREKAPYKRMRKIALVICEGETEVEYLNLIRKWYKSPVRIVSHIEGNRITQPLIDKHARELKISPFDKVDTFLMYDMDVPAINDKLMACKAELLLSNPCFEVWLLLHVKDQTSALSSTAVIKELKEAHPFGKIIAKPSIQIHKRGFSESILPMPSAEPKGSKISTIPPAAYSSYWIF